MTDIGERLLRDIGLTSRVRPAGDPARARLEQPEQPAQLGLQLRRLRRRGRRARTPGPWPRSSTTRGSASGLAAARARRSRPRPCSSAAITTPATTRSPSSTSTGSPTSHRDGVRGGPAGHRGDLRPQRPRALPAVHVGPADALVRRPPAQHVEERSEDLAQTRPELGHATNAITHRRPPRVDPRPVPRPPGLPHLVRPDPGRRRELDPDAHPPGRLPRLRRDQPGVLLLERRQRRLRRAARSCRTTWRRCWA